MPGSDYKFEGTVQFQTVTTMYGIEEVDFFFMTAYLHVLLAYGANKTSTNICIIKLSIITTWLGKYVSI